MHTALWFRRSPYGSFGGLFVSPQFMTAAGDGFRKTLDELTGDVDDGTIRTARDAGILAK